MTGTVFPHGALLAQLASFTQDDEIDADCLARPAGYPAATGAPRAMSPGYASGFCRLIGSGTPARIRIKEAVAVRWPRRTPAMAAPEPHATTARR